MARSSNQRPPKVGGRAEAERRYADEVGFYWEEAGGTRMAGRVLGALLLADPPELSSSALASILGVSAGSISTATRELINPGVVVRVRVPGERQDHFRAELGAAALPQFLQSRLAMTHRWVELLRRGAELADGKDPAVRRQLDDARELYEFLEAGLADLVEQWNRRTADGARNGRR